MITALANHLWQSTLFAAAAAIVTLLLRQYRASVRYGIWLAASAKFLIPFAWLIAAGQLVPWRSTTPSVTSMAAVDPSLVSAVFEQVARPFDDVSASMNATSATSFDWTLLVAGVWMAGLLTIAFARWRGWRAIHRALDAARPPQWITGSMSKWTDTLPVVSCPGLIEPSVVGIWRPVLLLPETITSSLTSSQLEAVIAHELCHVRRRDNLTSAIHMTTETLFWFHPLIWWIGARLTEERERACDEAVLARGLDPRDYAAGILNVCKAYVESPLACVSGVTGADLKKRIAAIVAGHVGIGLTGGRKTTLFIGAAAVLALPIVIGILTAPARLAAQTVGTVPRFEVVSVRPCVADDPGAGRSTALGGATPGRIYLSCYSTLRLIQTAYGTYADGRAHSEVELPVLPQPNELVQLGMDHTGAQGVPDWVSRERYTIEAKAVGEPPALVMVGPMLQGVLEDRFKVKTHREMREVDVYEIVVAKSGAKLTPFKPGSCVQYDFSVSPQPPLEPGQHRCVNANRRDSDGNYIYEMEAATLDDFAAQWSKGWIIGRPLVNKTGLTGRFTFQVKQDAHLGSPDESRAQMIEEFKNRLGLELRPGKAQREFLMIDHVERPIPDDRVPATPALAASAQTPAAGRKFDVASIRPCDPEPVPAGGRSGGGNGSFSPGRAYLSCFVVKNLVNTAYVNNRETRSPGDPLDAWNAILGAGDGKSGRIRGGPDWVYTDKYTIEATASGLDPSQPSRGGRGGDRDVILGPMLRTLLEDRFKIKVHTETEDTPMWALTVAKNGFKLKANGADGFCTTLAPNEPGPGMDEEIAMVRRGEKPICGHGIMGGRNGGNEALALGNQDMAGVARALSLYMDRMVVDQTGIAGRFNAYLEFAPDDFAHIRTAGIDSTSSVPSTAASLPTALERLGLRLEPTKGSRGFIVIDHIERPKPDAPLLPPARAHGPGR